MPTPTATEPTGTADLTQLATGFTTWLGKSGNTKVSKARARHQAAPGEPVFSTQDDMVNLNATSASRLIRSGLRAGRVDELVELLGLPKKEDLSHALNANSTSLWRWARDDKPLPSQTVEQILRAMQLQLFATDVFGGVVPARTWLSKSHPMLDDMSPSDYADNEFGAQKVRGMLAGLKYGGVA